MATLRIPISRQARMTRRATSPRFATSILPITVRRPSPRLTLGPDAEERLVVLHTLRVLDQHLHHLARDIREDLVHQLHRLDDAQSLSDPHVIPDLDVKFLSWRRRSVKGPDYRRTHQMQAPVALRRVRLRHGLRGRRDSGLVDHRCSRGLGENPGMSNLRL